MGIDRTPLMDKYDVVVDEIKTVSHRLKELERQREELRAQIIAGEPRINSRARRGRPRTGGEDDVIDAVQRSGRPLSPAEVAASLGISHSAANNRLARAVLAKRLIRLGRGLYDVAERDFPAIRDRRIALDDPTVADSTAA